MANRLLLRYLSGAALLLAGVNEAGGLLSPGFSVADVIFQVPGRPWASDAYVLASAAALGSRRRANARTRAASSSQAKGFGR